MSGSEVWDQLLHGLRTRLPEAEIERFLLPLEPTLDREAGDRLILEAPSRELARVVQEQFAGLLLEEFQKVSERAQAVEIRWAPSPQRELFPNLRSSEPSPQVVRATSHTYDSGLQPGYTFEQFVQGSTTQFAHAAALAVAKQPGRQYNPLFLYGPTGSGKTHLLQAIGNLVVREHPDWRVRYVTADTFMTELVTALRKEQIAGFKQRYRQLDFLLVDDVHTLANRERTQEEFFHLFNALYDHGKQIVLAASQPPQRISGLEERLVNRFQWGLLADLQLPDLETRIAMLERKAEAEQIDLTHEVATYIASRISGSARELYGCLVRVAALSSLRQRPIDTALAAEVVESSSTSEQTPLTIEKIQQVVADFFGIRPAELRSKRRDRSVSLPRQIAMYLCREHLLASFPTIGERFGRRDHTTAMYAVQTIQKRRNQEAALRTTLQQLEERLLALGKKL